jgi:Bacterial Ig-like domain (group 1)
MHFLARERRGSRRVLLIVTLLGLAAFGFTPAAHAAPGDLLKTITTSCPGNGSGGGIGVAFDGTNILYTCANEAQVHFTDISGAALGSIGTLDAGGNPVSVDAIAWDSNLNTLWGGDLDGSGNCRIWKVDTSSGAAMLQFSFTDPSGFCSAEFFDGLRVDTSTNTLYLSPDVNPTIRHFSEAGAPLPGDPIPFSTLADGNCTGFVFPGCPNSGLAIGIDGVLFAGTNGFSKIVELNPTVPSFLGVFASVSGRDEDLECGPLFAKADGSVVETILSREFFSGNIAVLEAPRGTCVTYKLGLTPPTATNMTGSTHTVTATLTANSKPLAGQTILFSVSGANTTSGSAVSDASGSATFSYIGTNFGNDTITACADINKNGACDPEEPTATATKTWEAPITATGKDVSATEGQSFTGPVATFHDPDTSALASEYSATIDWGDLGPTSSGTIISNGGGDFTVTGTHTYAEEGTYPVTVTITDLDNASNTATTRSTATVADAALAAACISPLTVSPQSFAGGTATFTDADPNGIVTDYTSTIDWGDASAVSSGTISGGPGSGPYTVSGSHTYTSTGFFTVTTTVTDHPSTAKAVCQVLIFAFAPGRGGFVIGNNNSANGTSVTFWGAQWWKLNSLSGGTAPAAFKGYAINPATPSCGTGWSTDPGNSAPPPAGPLPAFMGVIVSSSISKSGSQISGDTPHIVVVQTNPGYDTNPGHAGTGKVVAQFC